MFNGRLSLLRNSRKTGAVSSAPPEGLASSSTVWRRASAPFALIAILVMSALAAQRSAATPDAIFAAAQAAAQAEDLAKAEAMLLSIRLSYPDRTALESQLALVQYHRGHFADSQMTLEGIVSRHQDDGATHNLLGWCAHKLGHGEAADQQLNQSIRLDPSNETNYLDLARIDLEDGQLGPARDIASRATDVFSSSAQAWLLKGSIEIELQNYPAAVKSYSNGVRLGGDDAETERALATAQWLAGMTGESRKTFEKSLVRYPRDAAIFATYGALLANEAAATNNNAEELLRKALSLDDSLFEPHYYLGTLALRGGRFEEAVHHLESAARLNPDSSKVHFVLSKAYRRLGRSGDSGRELEIYKRLKMAENRH
jgi:tetratricopeptide (TPR) repeat protein